MIPHSQPFIDPTDASAIESRLQTGMIAAGPLCDESAAAGVAMRRGVDALLHRDYQLSDSQFPNAVRCYRTTCSIPLYPSLSDRDVDRICAAAAFLWP